MKLFKRLACFIGGHHYDHAIYHNISLLMDTPFTHSLLVMHPELKIGGSGRYFYDCLVAECKRCGEKIVADDLNLPIIEPDKYINGLGVY